MLHGMDSAKNIALVHDWLTGMRGGEKCLEVLCELFPDAPIYTLLGYKDAVSDTIASHDIRSSFLQKMPKARTMYRQYLPLFPRAIESLDLRGHDLVVSSSHAVAKGVRTDPGALHISYVHTPMRYVWDMFDQYFSREQVGHVKRAVARLAAARLRAWDVRSCPRVHHFIANSEYVRGRIQRFYGRDAAVIYPPVDTQRFHVSHDSDGGFLMVSALVPYKRVDLAIRAFNELALPLRVIGDGPERRALEAIAGPTIRLDGWVDDAGIEHAMAQCAALIFPGEEDFGIVPVEAMACGKPVIAFRKGGATETVRERLSGLFFDEQTPASLAAAVRRFSRTDFDPLSIRAHAETFDREIYRQKMAAFITEKWHAWQR